MRIIIADPDADLRRRVARAVDGLGEVVHADTAVDVLRAVDAPPDGGVVVLGPAVPADRALTLAQRVQEVSAAFAVVALARAITTELLREAMRAGVRDVLPRDFDPDELRGAVKRAGSASVARPDAAPTPPPAPPRGRVVTVFSTKGGSGKSLVAANLAVLLSQRDERRVALVDLDLGSGDLAIMLQTLPSWTIHDAVEKLDRLDTEALDGYLSEHPSGVRLLAAPPEPSLAEAISGEAVTRVIALLREQHDVVVVDGPAAFTDPILAALDVSDELVLVTGMDVPSVKNLKLALHTLDQLGWGRQRTRVVVNRADPKVGLRTQDVSKSLGTSIDVAIPSSRDVPLSINEGRPLVLKASRSEVADALRDLTERILDDLGVEAAPQTEAGGRARRLLRRS